MTVSARSTTRTENERMELYRRRQASLFRVVCSLAVSRPAIISILVLVLLLSVPSTSDAFTPLKQVKSATALFVQTDVDDNKSRTWDQAPSREPTQTHNSIYHMTRSKPHRPRQPKTKPMPVTGYNSKAIIELYDRRPLQVGWRLNWLGLPLLGTFACLSGTFALQTLAHNFLM
jgi:hypothetical protein